MAPGTRPRFPDVTLGLTSWQAPGTLAHTLSSYAQAGILEMFGAAHIHFNAISACDRELAARYGLSATGTPDNIGIFGAVDGNARQTRTRYLLSVENDCPLVTDGTGFATMLSSALTDMVEFDCPVFQMRSRRQPGDAFNRRARYEARFRVTCPIDAQPTACKTPIHPLVRLYEDCRKPSLRACALYSEEDPAARHPTLIKRSPRGNWLTSSRHLNWSNNCVLVRTDFLRDVILERVRSHPSPKRVNGHQDIEAALKIGRWWRYQDIRMGQSEPGPFTHQRLDR